MTEHTGIRTHDPNSTADPRLTPPPASEGPATGAVTSTAPRHDDDRRITVRTESTATRTDRIRWSAVWAGLIVALALYLFLQLALITTGIVDLADATSADAFWSAAAALVAFLVGGVVAGASAVWRDADDGLLHGIVMWAVGVVALVVLAAAGGGVALGTVDASEVFDELTGTDASATATSDDAEEAAGWALIGLTSALVASAIGATVGAKMWPRRRHDEDHRNDREYGDHRFVG
jgi:hypothetical protein